MMQSGSYNNCTNESPTIACTQVGMNLHPCNSCKPIITNMCTEISKQDEYKANGYTDT